MYAEEAAADGTSATNAKSGSALLVVVSVPPIEISLGTTPSVAVALATTNAPVLSVVPLGSSVSWYNRHLGR